jgi:hypothetical protein
MRMAYVPGYLKVSEPMGDVLIYVELATTVPKLLKFRQLAANVMPFLAFVSVAPP